jgi:hypothetical protein
MTCADSLLETRPAGTVDGRESIHDFEVVVVVYIVCAHVAGKYQSKEADREVHYGSR